MYFSPLTIGTLIVEPLRFFFSQYTIQSKFVWNEDEKLRTVEISAINDLNRIALNERPRILVDRGDYQVVKTGLTDNLYQGKSFSETKGLDDRSNLVFYQGNITILIEAINEGSCEVLADMATHFIVWSRPFICSSQGFKEFGLPMSVSSAKLDSGSEGGTPKFQISVNCPYMREESWKVNNDSIKIKDFISNLSFST